MRVRFITPLLLACMLVWGAPVRADSVIATCDVLNTSTETITNAYPTAFCGTSITNISPPRLAAQATLSAIELNIAFNSGGTKYFYFSTLTGDNFVGQSSNHIYEPIDFTGIGIGFHKFDLPTPLTFAAGDAPHFLLYGDPHAIDSRSNIFVYGSDVSNGQQEVFYQKWFWAAAPPSVTLLGNATTTVEFGSTFADPGATAHDDTDGDITSAVRITGSVDTSTIGTSTLAYSVTDSHGLSATTTRAVVVACTHDCVSSVLFLPGIEGSRLYEGVGCGKAAEEKLWEPYESVWGVLRGVGDRKVKDLSLDQAGVSVCSDIYAKEGDIVDSVNDNNIYASLISQMNGLRADGTIANWKPVAYDWRFSLDDLLNKGSQHSEKIFYEEATSTPYIEQTLRTLATGSKTGKVTIIAHSNGGLVAKALLNRLGSEASKSLVDKVIMVGVPQSGAPADVGAMLVGYNAGIYSHYLPVVSNAAARALTQNSPMAYHLLPSQEYFDSVMDDPAYPVARFAGDGYTKELSAYGSVIGTVTELDSFLLAHDGGREKPREEDLKSAEILNPALIDYANSTHTTLDPWVPPAGIEVDQIAGWGVDTVGGVDFYTAQPTAAATALDPYRAYRPIMIEDGDGTVPVPSALLMASSTDVKRYWLNLDKFNREQSSSRKHPDLFEISPLREFIINIIRNSTSTLPSYISSTQPSPTTESKKLTFFLHSPLTLQLTDASGHVTGLADDGSVSQNIPGSSYGEFGEVKYVTVPQGSTYQLSMHGQASGTFSLDIQESSGSTITASSTIANVPTTANTLANLSISGGISTASVLTVDENGDGKVVSTVTPRIGEVVGYTPPAPTPAHAPAPQTSAEGSVSTQPVSPMPIGVAASTTRPIATSTAEVLEPVQPVLAERKVLEAAANSTYKPQKSVAVGKKMEQDIPQTASAYDASQQPVLQKLGATVYNGLHRLWVGLQRIFSLKK